MEVYSTDDSNGVIDAVLIQQGERAYKRAPFLQSQRFAETTWYQGSMLWKQDVRGSQGENESPCLPMGT